MDAESVIWLIKKRRKGEGKMSYHEDQETILRYDRSEGRWFAFSSYGPHIQKIERLAEKIVSVEADANGNLIEIEAFLGKKGVKIGWPNGLDELSENAGVDG